ncbi:inositol polyphosphate 1-phosphatase-like [Actinia tenebrosa]|uniref:inositol-1,4-bisphosphate 1-phosphatase n=1 Tax=Actinia tenebrosa TaxID=6105 RepID=A0A6P8IAN0_ACTTE|nr:inositol polyphosphate 1-phosphatase-like [Actinia tenebrosa]
MADLIRILLKASEKSAEIARTWIKQDELFSLLVEEKIGEAKNDRFVQDFKTLTDVLVQETIKHEILSQFTELNGYIYGEESNVFTNSKGSSITVEIKENPVATANHLRKVMNDNNSAATLLANIVHNNVTMVTEQDDENLKNIGFELDINNIGIWIDPIDGTAEYISRAQGKTENGILSKGLPCATVLIGVFNKSTGEALGGVINQPFSRYDQKNRTWRGQIIWGISKNHSLSDNNLKTQRSINNNNEDCSLNNCGNPFSVVISSSEDNELKEKLKATGIMMHEIAAVGFKLLNVIDETVNVYLLSKGSSFKWDTCAAHGILNSMGGGVVSFQTAVQIASECGFADSDLLKEKLKDSQLVYHKPDNELSEPGKMWSNSKGLIAFRNFKDLFIILKTLTVR